MKICGIELSGNDAVITLLNTEGGMFVLPECRVRRVTCKDPDDISELKYFQKTMLQLFNDYQVEKVVIKARMKKGRFAGGANGFKLEAALQLMPDLDVVLLSAADQKAFLKHQPLPISFAETGLKKFQETAFMAAYAFSASSNKPSKSSD